jgi:hypothetical protein
MRLPPSVVSLIEAHLIPPQIQEIPKPSYKAFAANLRPLTPGSISTSRTRNQIRPKPAQTLANTTPALASKSAPKRDPLPPKYKTISLHGALERYAQNPSIALGTAHRLLDDKLSAPSTSSLVTNLIRRQRVFERIIRTCSQHPTTATVTIASIYQRMIEEGVPPNTDILKIVLGTAIKHGTPILPILRQLVGNEGLPEKMDIHLLVLIIRGIAREVVIKPSDLERVIEDCLISAGITERPVEFDEILVESYGRIGDLRGIINLLSKYKYQVLDTTSRSRSRSAVLSLHLQALTQWIENPLLRRKRRGSLFPRALAKDLIPIYGGPERMPLEWLNAWMNGERIAGNLRTALNIWQVITSLPTGPDRASYSAYMRLIKLLPTIEGCLRLREVIKHNFSPNSMTDTNILEHALSAAFTHDDLPLILFLARQLDYSPDQHHPGKMSATARMIDITAAGIVRLQRLPVSANQSRSNGLSPDEWRGITYSVQEESRRIGTELNISLPLSTPQAGLVPDQGGGDYVGRYKPRSGTQMRASLVLPLVRLLEQEVLHRYKVAGDRGGDEEVLKKVMMDLHAEILT